MLVLVANLGSTSFKFRLLDMGRRGLEIARGSYDRIGLPGSSYSSHAQVVDDLLTKLERPPDAIGFKAVQGGPIAGDVRVTDQVIGIMQQFADIAPAHNPPYIAAMKALRQKLPGVPQVAAFDSTFTRRSRCRGRRTPSRMNGWRNSASGVMASMAIRTVISPSASTSWSTTPIA